MLWVLKSRLNDTVLLSTQNICLKWSVRQYLQFYAEKFCLSKPLYIHLFVVFSLSFAAIVIGYKKSCDLIV